MSSTESKPSGDQAPAATPEEPRVASQSQPKGGSAAAGQSGSTGKKEHEQSNGTMLLVALVILGAAFGIAYYLHKQHKEGEKEQ